MQPQALVAKFGTNFISSQVYMLETLGEKQTPLKFILESPWIDYSATTGPGGQIWN